MQEGAGETTKGRRDPTEPRRAMRQGKNGRHNDHGKKRIKKNKQHKQQALLEPLASLGSGPGQAQARTTATTGGYLQG